MMYDGWWGWSWGGWVLMSVVMVLFWATVITAIVVATRYLVGSAGI
jgi:putative membrane protein